MLSSWLVLMMRPPLASLATGENEHPQKLAALGFWNSAKEIASVVQLVRVEDVPTLTLLTTGGNKYPRKLPVLGFLNIAN